MAFKAPKRKAKIEGKSIFFGLVRVLPVFSKPRTAEEETMISAAATFSRTWAEISPKLLAAGATVCYFPTQSMAATPCDYSAVPTDCDAIINREATSCGLELIDLDKLLELC